MELLPEELLETIIDHPLKEADTGQVADSVDIAVDTMERAVLPEIDGIDWNQAHLYIQDDRVLLSTLKNIYRAMDSDLNQLTKLYKNIYNEEGMAEYRIKVHALKSTNASVGAQMVSQLANLLEQKAIEQDAQAIERLHPELITQMKKLQEKLCECYGCETEGQQSQMSQDAQEQNLQELIEALRSYDYDKADELTEKLQDASYSDQMKECLAALREQEFQLDFDACIETATQMLEMISSERG